MCGLEGCSSTLTKLLLRSFTHPSSFLLTLGSFVSAFSLPLTTASLPFAPQGTFFTHLLSVRGSGPFLRATTVLTVLGVPGYCHTEMTPWCGNAAPNPGRQQTPQVHHTLRRLPSPPTLVSPTAVPARAGSQARLPRQDLQVVQRRQQPLSCTADACHDRDAHQPLLLLLPA